MKSKAPPPIHPTAMYDRATLMMVVPGVRYSSIAAEVKAGRLRRASRLGRDYFLGQWVLDWIAAGEVRADLPG